jgi:hypothetical protein
VFPHLVGDGGAPQVVHIPRPAKHGGLFGIERQLFGRAGRQLRNASGVTVVERRLEVHHIAEGPTHTVEP